MELSIVIPAYNEEKAIKKVVTDIQEHLKDSGISYEIIVVNDCSKDNTAAVLEEVEGIRVINHKKNMGVGRARKTGLAASSGKYIAMTDGDDTYPADRFKDLYDKINNGDYDMVIGARKVEMGTVKILRTFAKLTIRKLAEFLTKEQIEDLNSGLRIFKKDVAEKYITLLPEGHSWVSTITLAFLTDGYTVGFLPINYFKRKGKSTFHPFKDTYNYVMTVVRTVVYFKPLNFFMPIAFISFTGFLLSFIRDCYRFKIEEMSIVLFILTLFVFFFGIMADQFQRIRKEILHLSSEKNKVL